MVCRHGQGVGGFEDQVRSQEFDMGANAGVWGPQPSEANGFAPAAGDKGVGRAEQK